MVDAAKEILDLLKHMPEYTIWVLIGLLFYKIVIIGSYFGVARLLIVKLHDFMIKPKVVQYEFDSISFLSTTKSETLRSIERVIEHLEEQPKHELQKAFYKRDNYFHSRHSAWLRDAVETKILAEKQLRSKEQK